MEALLRCKVYPGQFSEEYAVSAEPADRSTFSLFAPSKYVQVDEPPTRDGTVDGMLMVTIWENLGNTTIVQLPRESSECGRFVTVDANQLQSLSHPIEA